MTPASAALVAAAGPVAGGVNAVAGGGTLVSFPGAAGGRPLARDRQHHLPAPVLRAAVITLGTVVGVLLLLT